MRDHLMDAEYFTRCIETRVRLAERARESMESGRTVPERVPSQRDYIAMQEGAVLMARYSRGDPLGDIAGMLVPYVRDWLAGGEPDSYSEVLSVASLAYLLGGDAPLLADIWGRARSARELVVDPITEFVAFGRRPQGMAHRVLFRAFDSLSAAINDSGPGREGAMRRYLRYWYQRHQSCWWWGLDKDPEHDLYFGYWAVEAAAVARRLGMDDAPLKRSRYYPYDLAHFLDGREGLAS